MSQQPIPVLDRLQQLDAIEKEISNALQCAGQGLFEMSKEKPVNKQIEIHSTQFLKTMEGVEKNLTTHINYLTQVSTGQPHEGSSYAAQKDLNMACHRIDHVRSRLAEMDRLKSDAVQPPFRSAVARSLSGEQGFQRGPSQAEQLHLLQRGMQEPPGGLGRNYSHDLGGH